MNTSAKGEMLDVVSAADAYRVGAGNLVHLVNIGELPRRPDANGRLHFERSVLDARFERRFNRVNLSQTFC